MNSYAGVEEHGIDLLPEAGPEDMRILRQALSGMIWTRQFFHYAVERWLAGDVVAPGPQLERPPQRLRRVYGFTPTEAEVAPRRPSRSLSLSSG